MRLGKVKLQRLKAYLKEYQSLEGRPSQEWKREELLYFIECLVYSPIKSLERLSKGEILSGAWKIILKAEEEERKKNQS